MYADTRLSTLLCIHFFQSIKKYTTKLKWKSRFAEVTGSTILILTKIVLVIEKICAKIVMLETDEKSDLFKSFRFNLIDN